MERDDDDGDGGGDDDDGGGGGDDDDDDDDDDYDGGDDDDDNNNVSMENGVNADDCANAPGSRFFQNLCTPPPCCLQQGYVQRSFSVGFFKFFSSMFFCHFLLFLFLFVKSFFKCKYFFQSI